MTPQKGYIPVRGHIDEHVFEQTLVPVKDGPYRLYVNGLMLKGSGAKVGDTSTFTIEQTTARRKDVTMPTDLRNELVRAKLLFAFDQLTPSRQKEILRYLNYLKTPQAKKRNIDQVLSMLKGET